MTVKNKEKSLLTLHMSVVCVQSCQNTGSEQLGDYKGTTLSLCLSAKASQMSGFY